MHFIDILSSCFYAFHTANLHLHLSLASLPEYFCISYFHRFSIENLGMGINFIMTDKNGRIKKERKKKAYYTCIPLPRSPSHQIFSFEGLFRQNERTARKTRILYRMSIYQTINVLFM